MMLSPFPSRVHLVLVCLDFAGALTVRRDSDFDFAFDMDFDIDFDFTIDMEFDIDSFANTIGNWVIVCGLDDSLGGLSLCARLWK